MADAHAPAAAPAAPTPSSPPPSAEKKAEHGPAPEGRGFNTKAWGLGILAVVLAYLFGLDNLQIIFGNLGKRGADVTDPATPWSLPAVEPNMLFMGVVIVIALIYLFKGDDGKKVESIKKKEGDHGHGHH
jgi:hypothetical protein